MGRRPGRRRGADPLPVVLRPGLEEARDRRKDQYQPISGLDARLPWVGHGQEAQREK